MQYGLFLYLCVSENLIILKYKFFWESSDWNVVVIVVVQSLSLWPHELQHTRLLCPSLSRVFAQTHIHWVSDATQTSHPLLSPSPLAVSLSQHQRSIPVSQLFASGAKSIGVSASTSVLPMNTQDWSPLGWTGWIFLQSRVFSSTTV